MTEAMGRALAERWQALGRRPVAARRRAHRGRARLLGGRRPRDAREHRQRGAADPGDDAAAGDRAFMRGFYGLFLSVRDLPCPSIAAIQGAAIGAGLCIALACDLRIAARDAKLGLNFTRLGIHPGMGSSWTLPRLVGPAHAADLLYTGRIVDGVEAERIGLVNRAVDATACFRPHSAMARRSPPLRRLRCAAPSGRCARRLDVARRAARLRGRATGDLLRECAISPRGFAPLARSDCRASGKLSRKKNLEPISERDPNHAHGC